MLKNDVAEDSEKGPRSCNGDFLTTDAHTASDVFEETNCRFPSLAFVAPDFSVSCECRKITMGNKKEGVVSRVAWSKPQCTSPPFVNLRVLGGFRFTMRSMF